ncbi:hypothetical protein HRR83_005420 [Exophiala dermatitidis]|nr:hypothetical protein HRR74_005273 [Exophiala dermatitidis]KAJ4518479.1 hypothetical protein HRR73_004060 [Exophiala dermatitidis]KAJ4533975.1 hypothetical protein HRR76_005924 [Exophiala dermatitidis]KAJ4550130.1 hypothetical protein HRR77_003610 [Exophiala dermatitidis]KAJ4554509.1 hypothetical protein HRR78_002913 [Exophiala dermatitidis]
MSPSKDDQPRRQHRGTPLRPSFLSQASSAAIPGARRPTTTNIDNPINPAPRVPGQAVIQRTTTDPQDRGLGFQSLNSRRRLPPSAPHRGAVEPAWWTENRRIMAENEDPTFWPLEEEEQSSSSSGSNSNGGGDKHVEPQSDVPAPETGGKRKRRSVYYGVPPLPKTKKRRRNKASVRLDAATKASHRAISEEDDPADLPLPEYPAQASEADRMLYTMAGRVIRDWSVIESRWQEITGQPGVNLVGRFLAMIRNYAAQGVLDLTEEVLDTYRDGQQLMELSATAKKHSLIARLKQQVEEEREDTVWREVSRRYQLATGDGVSAANLRAFWNAVEGNEHLEERSRAPGPEEQAVQETSQAGQADLTEAEFDRLLARAQEREKLKQKEEDQASSGPLVPYASDSD